MTKAKEKTVSVPSHWRHELTKLRCFLTGYKEGRGGGVVIPGEDILRQIMIAIDDA